MLSNNNILNLEDFDYNINNEKIALYPSNIRHNSKLLVYNENKQIIESIFLEIDKFIESDSLLILNNTQTINARLLFDYNKQIIEVFCLSAINNENIDTILYKKNNVKLNVLIGNFKKLKTDILEKKIIINKELILLKLTLLKKPSINENYFIVELEWNKDYNFINILNHFGIIPIPPYLKRATEILDNINYQTIFAKNYGSVATPTAGLHFTENIFEKLIEKNIINDFITLHVSADTFKPIKEKNVLNHKMHGEKFIISNQTLQLIIKFYPKIYSVGTTSLRTLESLYYLGLNIKNNTNNINYINHQSLNNNYKISYIESINIILDYFKKNNLEYLECNTKIMITPDYKIKSIKGLITNFHQPKSTLLLIVKSLVGNDWKKIYDYALLNNFRFFSYGDACLLFNKNIN